MRWLFGARHLRERGILGMNRRNADYILPHNSLPAMTIVDDKLRMHRLCAAIDAPTPEVYAVFECLADLRQLAERLKGRDDCVIKPARGSGGRGVLVLMGRDGSGFRRSNGATLALAGAADHMADILSGMHSLGGRPDAAIVQQRVRLHPAFAAIAVQGIPDVRIVLYRGEPALAMLRLPTRQSNGRANLHQGGLGVGVDLATGVTHHAVQADRPIREHPDTGATLLHRPVPLWNKVLELARRVTAAVGGLGYLGVDIVLDEHCGPLLLEVNARPGLAIQHANGRGLLPELIAVDRKAARVPLKTARVHRSRRVKAVN